MFSLLIGLLSNTEKRCSVYRNSHRTSGPSTHSNNFLGVGADLVTVNWRFIDHVAKKCQILELETTSVYVQ